MNRTRNHAVIIPGLYNSKGWDVNGKLVFNADTPYSWSGNTAYIADVVGNRQGNNPVSSYNHTFQDGYIRLPRAKGPTGYSQEVVFNGTVGWAGLPALPSTSLDYTDAVNGLLRDAVGSMPTGVNLIVNAAEFASLKTLIPSLLAGFKGLVKKRFGRRSIRELAGSHLAYEFGLVPLVGDLSSMFSIRGKVENRIKELLARNGRSTRLVKRVAPIVIRDPIQSVFSSYPGHVIHELGQWSGTCEGAVSADVNSFFVDDPSAKCKLWSSALGLSTPLQSIWELVPLSVVMGWFIPVGETFLRIEDKLGFHSTVRSCELSNFVYSEKKVCTTQSILKCVSASTYPGWVGVKGAATRWNCKSYIRTGGIPSTGYLSTPSGWTCKRSALSISLIAQRAFK